MLLHDGLATLVGRIHRRRGALRGSDFLRLDARCIGAVAVPSPTSDIKISVFSVLADFTGVVSPAAGCFARAASAINAEIREYE